MLRKFIHAVPRKLSSMVIETLEGRTMLTSVVVNSISDTATGVVTLRDAIAIANGSTDPTNISFDPTVFATAQTIVLGGTQLVLTNTAEPTTITGPTSGVTVSGNNVSRVLEVDQNVTASLSGVNFIDGNSFGEDGDGSGGGIFNVGTLTITNGNVSGNKSEAGGGGINNSSTLTLTNVTVSNNTAGDRGGGIENYGGRLGEAAAVLTNVTITGNSTGRHGGGGIASDANGLSGTTTLIMNGVTITDNTAVGNGGGILLDSSSMSLALNNVTVLNNSATGSGGGFADLGGTATLSHATIGDNTATTAGSSRGGGLYVEGTLSVSDSTFSGNSTPYYGGGVDVEGGTLTLIDDTLADNSAGGVGGLNNGASSTTTLEDVTLSGNSTVGVVSDETTSPGGAANDASAVLLVSNSIVAGNSNALDGTGYPDATGQISSLGHNFIGSADNSTGWLGDDLTGTTASPLNADLSALADNGGPTKTLLPLTGSPVIGAGSIALIPSGVNTDQRGVTRTANGAVDIGSVELGGADVVASASVTTFTASAQTILVGSSDTFTITVASTDGSGAVPNGTVSIYQDGNFTSAFTLIAGVAKMPVTALKATPNTVYTAVYSGDANYAASTSSTVTQVYLTKSAIVGKIGKVILPAAGISGQKFTARIPVTLTNTGPTVKGTFVETLYLDSASVSDGGLSASPLQLMKLSKSMTFKAGKTLPILFGIKSLPASLLPGTYHLVVKTTDPSGNVDIETLDQTITVAAPLVALAATAGALKPAVIAVNKKGSLVITVTNNGNIAATGFLVISLSPSLDGISPAAGIVLTKPVIHTTIKPGKTGKYTLHIRIPAVLTAGTYYTLATVSFGDITTTAVGPQFTAG